MRKKDVVFSQDEFDNAGRIDRLYMAMIQPDEFILSNDESVYLDILTRAYPIICTGRPKSIVIKQIGELEDKWNSQVIKIYKDAQDLYARFEEVNTRVLRGIFIEKQTHIAEMMEDLAKNGEDELARAKAADVARRCWEAIAKFTRIERIDDVIDTTPPPPAPLLRVHESYKKIEKAQIIDDRDTDDY